MTGSGILNDPYLIETVSDWSEISTHSTNSYYYKLVNDLDFSGSVITPITSFSGYIDGNYKRLKYFIITTVEDNSGLFGLITSSNVEYNIKNLEIYSGSVVTSKTYNFGYVAGKLENAKISNVHVVSCSNHIDNEFNGIIDGGFGFFAGNIVSSSIVSSSVKYGHYDFYDSFIYNTAYNFGGFVGRVDNSTIIDSFSDVNIYNVQNDLNPINIGGFVGYVDGGDTEILNCHAGNYITIDINSSSDYVIGGFAGYVNNCNLFENCYSNIWFNQDAPIGTYFNGFVGYSVNDNYNNCFFNLDRALSGQNSSYCVISGRSDKQSNSIVRLNDAEMKSLENYTEIDNYYLTFNGLDTVGFDKSDSILPDPYFDDKDGLNWELIEGTAAFGSVEVGQQGAYCVVLRGQTVISTIDLFNFIPNIEYIAKIRYKSTATITISSIADEVYKQLPPKGNWDYIEFYFTSSTSTTPKIKISIPAGGIAWLDSLYIVENTRADFDSVNILDDDIYNKVLELNGTGEQLYTESQPDLAVFDISSLSGTQLPTNYAVKAGSTTEIVTTEPGSSKCLKVVLASSPSGLYRNYTLSANSSYKARIKYKSTASIDFTSWTGFSETFYVLPATTEWNELEFTFNTTQAASEIYFRLSVVSTFFIEYFEIYEDVKNELNLNNEIIKHSKNKKFELSTKDNILVNSGYSGTTDWVDTNNDGLADTFSDQYALEFDGIDDYLQIALPSELVTNGNFETFPLWSSGNTISFTQDTETGKQGNYCAKWVFGIGGNLTITTANALVAGQKYKVKMYYKSTTDIVFQSSTTTVYTLKATSEWNYISFIFTAVGTTVRFYSATVAGTAFFDNVSMVFDQGFDLNKDQEQILHSKNCDFERTLGAEIATGTVTIGKKYIVTAGTVEGNAVGTEFLAVTATTTLDASNKVKEIPNLVTNGTFDSDTVWNKGTGWSISGGVATHTAGTASALSQTLLAIVNPRRFRTVFTVSGVTSGNVYIQLSGGGGGNGTVRTTNGTFTQDLVAGTASQGALYFLCSADFDGSIDSIHIYEIPEWTASGNHSCDVSTLDKSSGTQSLKVTASGAGRGAELITVQADREFSSVTGNWSLGTGWGISGGVLSRTNTGTLTYSSINISASTGKIYEVELTATVTSGTLSVFVGNGTANQGNWTTSGTYKIQFTNAGGGTPTHFYIYGNTTFAGSVDDISIKEVIGEVSLPSAQIDTLISGNKYTLEGFARLDASSLTFGSELVTDGEFTDTANWNEGAGWSISGGKLSRGATGLYDYTTQNISASIGKVYKVSFTISDYVAGIFRFFIGDGAYSANYQANGSYVAYYTHTVGSNVLFLWGTPDFNGSITVISVVEATPPTLTAQLGTKSVTSSALSIVAGTFTKFVLNFEATASEVNQDLKLWLSGAGSVFVDAISLTQAYDMAIASDKKSNSYADGDYILGSGAGSISQVGYDIYVGTNGNIYYALRSTSTQLTTAAITGNTTSNYIDFIIVVNRNSTNTSYIKSNKLNQNTAFDLSNEGKIVVTKRVTIGSYDSIYDAFNGSLGKTQIIRFENISQSTFNPALTGLQYPTGGGAEEVLRLTFQDGTSFLNALKDYSPKNHTVVSYGGMTIDNRIRHYGTGRNPEIGFTLNGIDESLQINRPLELITSNADMNSVTNTFWTTSGTVTFGDTSELERLNGVCKIVGSSGQGLRKDSLLTVGKKYFIRMRYKSTVDINFGNTSTVTAYKVFKSTSQWNTIEFSFTAVTNGNIVLYLAASGTAWIDNISIIQDLKFDLNDYERIIHSKNSTGDITTANSGSQTILDEYAISFNGTDEYLYRPLPIDIASFNISGLAHGSTSLPTGWSTVGSGATTVISTAEVGSQKCLICTMPAYSGIRYAALYLTNGKKYKFTIKYKQTGSSELVFGQNNGGYRYYLPQTTQWNTKVLTGVGIDVNNGYFLIYNNSATACTMYIESITIIEDWKLDLNESYELIKHSMDRDFEISYSSSMMSNTGYSGTTDWTNPDYDGLASSITGSNNYVLYFNGTDEYLYRSLPVNLLANGTFETGVNTDGWALYGTITFNDTEIGKTGNYCAKIVSTGNQGLFKVGLLTVGKKYKLTVRYKGTVGLSIGRNGSSNRYGAYPATSQWNTVVTTFTADTNSDFLLYTAGTGTLYIDDVVITEDWKLDLNESWELIKHSMNRDFERTLGAEIATGTVTIGKKYVVTAGTVEGNAVGTEFLAVTATTTLDANNKVKEIPNLVTNGTFDSSTAGWGSYNFGSTSLNEISSSTLKVTKLSGGVSDVGFAQYEKLIIGKRYRVTLQLVEATGTINGLACNGNTFITSATPQTKSIDFTASLTDLYFTLLNATDNDFVRVDNIHIYEIPEWTASGNHTCNVSTLDKSGTTGQSLLVSASGAGDSSNCVTLPSANLESCVSGKKYTLQGEGRLDPASLTYGANLVTNGVDWTDSNADGLADNCAKGSVLANSTATIVTGSGFIGNAQRLEIVNANSDTYLEISNVDHVAGKIYKLSFKYRTNSGIWALRSAAQGYVNDGPVNTGDAISMTTYIASTSTGKLRFYVRRSNSYSVQVGDYIEIGDVVLQQADAVNLTVQLGTKIVSSSALSVVAGTFTKFVLNFEATASEENADLKLWLSGAGNVYVDKLSLTQAYDWINIINFKWASAKNNYALIIGGGTDYIVTTGNSDPKHLTLLASNGATTILAYDNSNKAINTWYKTAYVLNRTDKAYQYMGGVVGSETPLATGIGKVIFGGALTVSTGDSSLAFAGQIALIQILRFTNISQSNFDPTTYKIGQSVTGGGAESVAYYNWKGNTDAEMISDKSGNSNHLTSSNITLALDRFPLNRYDGNASAFISNAAITSSQQRYAVDLLVKDLKTYNLWDKMAAVYPFVGANSSSHALNLKNPLNTDAAFRITWSGNVTHSSSGIKSDGSGYGDTKFNPVVQSSSLTDFSFGVYKKGIEADSTTRVYMGNIGSGKTTILGWANFGTSEIGSIAANGVPEYAPTASISNPQTQGFLLINSSGSRSQQLWTTGSKDGDPVISTTTFYSSSIFILSSNNEGTANNYTLNTTISFAYIGKGLSDIDAVNLTSIVNRYQNNLGRL